MSLPLGLILGAIAALIAASLTRTKLSALLLVIVTLVLLVPAMFVGQELGRWIAIVYAGVGNLRSDADRLMAMHSDDKVYRDEEMPASFQRLGGWNPSVSEESVYVCLAGWNPCKGLAVYRDEATLEDRHRHDRAAFTRIADRVYLFAFE